MDCREVRDLTDLYLTNELLVETTQRVSRHLDECVTCRADIDRQQALHAKLRSAFSSAAELQPPPEFASGLVRTLQRSQRSPHRRWGQAVAGLAAMIAVVLGFGQWHLAALARGAAGDHQNCAVRFRLASTPIPLADAPSVDSRVVHSLHALPAEMPAPGGPIRVMDRHICVFEGRRFAHVVMGTRGHVVSLVVPADAWPLVWPGAGTRMLPPDGGWGIVRVSAYGHAGFVVSDLDARSLEEVGRVLQAELSRG